MVGIIVIFNNKQTLQLSYVNKTQNVDKTFMARNCNGNQKFTS